MRTWDSLILGKNLISLQKAKKKTAAESDQSSDILGSKMLSLGRR